MDLLMELIDASTPASSPVAAPAAKLVTTPNQSSSAQSAQPEATRMDDRTSDSSIENRNKEEYF